MLNDILNSFDLYKEEKLSFEEVTIRLAKYQYLYNEVYRDYCQYLGVELSSIDSLRSIPFLPIEAFKQYKVLTNADMPIQQVFGSSGTTGSNRSFHHISDLSHYLEGAKEIFEACYGGLDNFSVFGLLPNYLERSDSSLVAMVDYFIKESKGGGFYLDQFEELQNALNSTSGRKVLFGVSFALLDFAEYFNIDKEDIIIMETGGMKGKREEMTKLALHNKLKSDFGIDKIHSEYGMTECCSQCYSKSNGIFDENRMMKLRIRDITDPYHPVKMGKSGVVQIVDLNNIHSCSFIETQDLGRKLSESTFEILGRIDNSDMRGCNLLVS